MTDIASPLLPDVLASGLVLTNGEVDVTIVRSSKRDDYGERLYRLKFPRRVTEDGWVMPGVTGHTLYSRDTLQGLGLVQVCANRDKQDHFTERSHS